MVSSNKDLVLWSRVRRLASMVGLGFGLFAEIDPPAQRAPWVGAKFGVLIGTKDGK